ncbi:MAG: DUF1570 domain-containing protein [Planctomycetes bacterium]|nr:DUF1570 domain-containing protein [Planctomycetota bacterium]
MFADAPDAERTLLVSELERTFAAVTAFCERLDLAVDPPRERMPVILFSRASDMAAFRERFGLGDDGAAGLYLPHRNLSVFLSSLARPELRVLADEVAKWQTRSQPVRYLGPLARRVAPQLDALCRRAEAAQRRLDALNEAFTALVVRHETAHQVFYNLGVLRRDVDEPAWLTEGLACLFETAGASADPATTPNPYRVADLRAALALGDADREVTLAALQAAIDAGRLVSLPTLIADPAALAASNPNAPYRFAQSWGLLHYLLTARRPALSEYLARPPTRDRGLGGNPQAELAGFEAVFGPLDADLALAWANHVAALPHAAGGTAPSSR